MVSRSDRTLERLHKLHFVINHCFVSSFQNDCHLRYSHAEAGATGTGQYKTRTADYGLWTGYKMRCRYRTRTGKYGLGIKHGLGIKRGLRTTLVKTVLIVLGKEK